MPLMGALNLVKNISEIINVFLSKRKLFVKNKNIKIRYLINIMSVTPSKIDLECETKEIFKYLLMFTNFLALSNSAYAPTSKASNIIVFH